MDGVAGVNKSPGSGKKRRYDVLARLGVRPRLSVRVRAALGAALDGR